MADKKGAKLSEYLLLNFYKLLIIKLSNLVYYIRITYLLK